MERCKEEVRRVQTGLNEIDQKEFLTPRQAAQYLAIEFPCLDYTSVDVNVKGLIAQTKTLVKRSDIDTLFAATERISRSTNLRVLYHAGSS